MTNPVQERSGTAARPSLLDWGAASTLALLVVATRLPFRTSMLYNWDSANFALALDHFDVTRHFPHPPGYFYYVMLARLIRVLVSDANSSLVVQGIIFSALAVVALYFLGRAILDRPTGLAAALLLTFSVTYWSLGTVALPYVSLAFFSTAMAFLAYQDVFAKRDNTLPLSIVYAVGGGFRPDLMLFLGPLWLLSMARKPRRRIAVGAFVVLGGFLLWYLPTVWLSGGFQGYHSTLLAYLQVDVAQKYSSTHRGLAGLLVNVRDTLSYLFYALYFALAPLLAGVAFLFRRFRSIEQRRAAFVACWIAPTAAFYVFIHVGDPGYVFTILPALLLLAASALTRPLALKPSRSITRRDPLPEGEGTSGRLVSGPAENNPPQEHVGADVSVRPGGRVGQSAPVEERKKRSAIPPAWRDRRVIATTLLLAVVLAGNIGLAMFYPRQLTLVGIRKSDEALRQKIEYVAGNLPPAASLLVSYETYRHLQYYLPQHSIAWIDIFDPREQAAGIPPGVAQVVLVDHAIQRLGLQDVAQGAGAGLQIVPVRGETQLVFAQQKLTLR